LSLQVQHLEVHRGLANPTSLVKARGKGAEEEDQVKIVVSEPSYVTPRVSCSQKYASQMSLLALDHSTFPVTWKLLACCCFFFDRPHAATSLDVDSRGMLVEEVTEIAEACVELMVDAGLEVNAGFRVAARKASLAEVSSHNARR
jgi:hypothetical protein